MFGQTHWQLLAELLIKTSLVIVCAAGLTLVCRRASAGLLHGLWLGAQLTALVTAAAVFSPIRWPIAAFPSAQPAGPYASENPPQAGQRFDITDPSLRPQRDSAELSGHGAAEPTEVGAADDASRADAGSGGASAGHPPTRPRKALATWLIWLLWLVGVAVSALPRAVGLVRLRRLAGESRPATDPRLLQRLAKTSDNLGIRRPVSLRIIDRPVIPMTWGLRQPVIILPADLTVNPDAPELGMALRHELAHVRRRDWLADAVSRLICVLLWFHPLIWLADRMLHRYRERACDDLAVGVRGDVHRYAHQLVTLAFRYARPTVNNGPALRMARSTRLEQRLRAILDPRRSRTGLSPARVTIGGLLGLIVGVSLGCAEPRSADADSQAAADYERPMVDAWRHAAAREGQPPAEPVQQPLAPRLTRAASVAYAVPMDRPQLDGWLDDWPEDAPRYPVMTNYGPYGATDIDELNLAENDDLAASFSVGYNVEDQMIYVALVVRDDHHVVGNRYDQTDAAEIFIQGTHTTARALIIRRGIGITALQYSGVAGDGSYSGDGLNPGLLWGNIDQTRAKMGSRRDEDWGLTIYEFAIQPFDSMPDKPTRIAAGMRMGFDLGVADKDQASEPPSLIYWGPLGAEKYFNPNIIGDLILGPAVDDMATLEGRIVDAKGRPQPWIAMEIHDEHGHPAGVATADGAGRYRFNLLPGRYFVSPAGSQGLKRDNRFPVALARGRTTNLDLVADPLPLPDALNKTLKVYDGLRSYSDVTIIRTSMGHINNLLSMEFAWAQPNRFAIHGKPRPFAKHPPVHVASNGQRMRMRAGDDGVSFEPAAPSVTQDVLRRLLGPVTDQAAYHMPFPELLNQSTRGYLPIDGFFGGLPTHRMVISGDPRRELLAMADRIELVNQDDAEAVEIDGQVCDVIQIVRPAANLIPRFPYWGERRGEFVTVYHYIARDSGLILRTQFQFDFATTFHSAFGARPAQIVEYRIDHQQIRLNPPLDGDVFRILDPIPITPGVH